MASIGTIREDNFLSQLVRVRREIQDNFMRTHKVLQEREADLLADLQRLEDEYTGHFIAQQIKQLLISKDGLLNTLKGNDNKVILEKSIAPIDASIKKLEFKLKTAKNSYKTLAFVWDIELEKTLNKTGNIQLNPVKLGMLDYKKVGQPITAFGLHNEARVDSPGIFRYPYAITINSANNYIYICDRGNNRVQVYNETFEFIFQFSERMTIPVGICIKLNKVYVTQFRSNCLNVYSTDGKYIQYVGGKGNEKMEFDQPWGLDISTEKYRIYISEYQNNRVHCVNMDLTFNSIIEDIYGAKDIILTSGEIVILSCRNPCISLYTYTHQLIREMIPCGGSNPVDLAYFFILDESLNILLSDYRSHCICVFSYGGEFIHKFGREGREMGQFIKPRGIAIDSQGKIIVVSHNPRYCVQVFKSHY